MAQNVRFVKTTKERYLNREIYDENALYFCQDTNEIFKGENVYTHGVAVVPTYADLPPCPAAADGVVYYITETRNGYVMAPDRSGWLQTIYAPATDAYQVPENEIYNTVTTVGAVRDIENAVYKYIDEEIAKVEVSGGQGADGKTPYIQDGYWYIDGVNTNVKAEGVNGKDGESAYEVWINAGHSGSEDDFLQWLKGDTEPFGNVVASIACGGIEAGMSLNGKTTKDVLTMLLGIQEAPKPMVDQIMENSMPAYSGTTSNQAEAVEYKLLDANAANYTDQGFYTTTDGEGNITSAGYQLTIEGNSNADAQVIAIPANAVIKMAYRYDLGGTNTWLPYTFDTTDEANYWLLSELFTTTVNGEEVVYQNYIYNIDVVGGGDALTSTEYWKFEIEVTN